MIRLMCYLHVELNTAKEAQNAAKKEVKYQQTQLRMLDLLLLNDLFC